MGGVYGEIDSRADFARVLGEAREISRRLLTVGANPLIEAILAQLEGLARATADGRVPTEDERRKVNVGLLAVRELDAERQDDSGLLARKLCVIDSFFREWPTDEQAKTATDADFWRRFGL